MGNFLILLILPLLLLSCTLFDASNTGAPRYHSDQYMKISPPAENSKWQVVEDDKSFRHYVRIAPDEYGPDHTIYATVTLAADDPSAASPEALSNLSKRIGHDLLHNPATKLHGMRMTEMSHGQCFTYSYSAEDPHPTVTAVMKKDTPYIIETTEYDCIHPYLEPQTMVVLTFSERYAKGDKPAGVEAERDNFFKKFTFRMHGD